MAMTDEERKAKKAASNRAYREANAEKEAARKRAYYQANVEKLTARQRAYREANPEKVAAGRRAYREANPEKENARQRTWREANPEKVAAGQRTWREANTDRIRKYLCEKMRTDGQFKAARLLRIWLHKALSRGTAPGRYGVLLGCTASELRAYIESHFRPGMTWANWGTVWEVDHIRALSSFDLLDPEQIAQAGHHTNLMPLTKAEHKAKTIADHAAARARRKQAGGIQP